MIFKNEATEFIRLSDCCILEKGNTPIQKAEPGPYPLVVTTKERKTSSSYQFDKPSVCVPLISSRGHGVASLNEVYYQDGKYAVGNILCCIIPDESVLYAKFLFYYLNYKKDVLLVPLMRGGANVSLTIDSLKRVKIPLPPLEVQREVVRILDVFTELLAELMAELTARKKQYDFYRDKLLSFDHFTPEERKRLGVRWMSFGDFATISRGASPRPIQSYITQDKFGINWIKIGDVSPGQKYITSCEEKITPDGASKSRRVYPGDFILSNSMSFGRPYILSIEGCIHDGWLSISNYSNTVTPDYLYHVLNSSYIQNEMSRKASSGTVKNLNADIVKSLSIPIPSMEYQRQITDILDRFDRLCSDITQGLPAEISARHKQYGYYRDKLLSFSE